jgi:hypothetical protein
VLRRSGRWQPTDSGRERRGPRERSTWLRSPNDLLGIASIVVAAVGSGAVVAALLYASRQSRALQGQLDLESGQAAKALQAKRAANDLTLMGHVMNLDRLFIESPELRPDFYEEVELPEDEPARSSVLATAELIVDLADAVGSMIRHDQLSPESVVAWAAALKGWGSSPAVQEILAVDEDSGAWSKHTSDLLNGGTDSRIGAAAR